MHDISLISETAVMQATSRNTHEWIQDMLMNRPCDTLCVSSWFRSSASCNLYKLINNFAILISYRFRNNAAQITKEDKNPFKAMSNYVSHEMLSK